MLRIGIFPLKGICPLASAFPTKDFNYSKTQPLSNETFNGRDRNGGYFGWLFLKRRDCVGNTLAVDVSTYCTVRGLIKKENGLSTLHWLVQWSFYELPIQFILENQFIYLFVLLQHDFLYNKLYYWNVLMVCFSFFTDMYQQPRYKIINFFKAVCEYFL